MPITIIGALMTIGSAKSVRLRVNLGTQRERPLWETFTITKKDGADGPSYALSCVSERPPAYWQDVSGAFDDPINDMCAGNADLWVETKRRTKRGVYVRRGPRVLCVHFQLQGCEQRGETGAPGRGTVRFRGRSATWGRRGGADDGCWQR